MAYMWLVGATILRSAPQFDAQKKVRAGRESAKQTADFRYRRRHVMANLTVIVSDGIISVHSISLTIINIDH
jgi:head-tail adaptor